VADLDLSSPGVVCRVFAQGAEANRDAACREGSIDVASAPGTLIASGDIHDNPVHLKRLVEAAGLEPREDGSLAERSHLTLHEIIHPDMLTDGVDLSYRALARVADLKRRRPEHVHTLLANHELAQMMGSSIQKNGVRCVEAFNDGLERVFGGESLDVANAVAEFVRSMPIALRCHCPQGDILCSHSLPGPAMMSRFDTSIIRRELTEADYHPVHGSATMLVWGRGYDHEQLEDLTERWGVNLFIVGHEHTGEGYDLVEPNCLVLNSDHSRGMYLPVDLSHKPRLAECPPMLKPLTPRYRMPPGG